MIYFLTTPHARNRCVFDQETLDFDSSAGYASVPGYIEDMLAIFRGELEPSVESRFITVGGKARHDLVMGSIVHQWFVSGRLRRTLLDRRVVGCGFRKEIILDDRGAELDYYRLIVSGRCGEMTPVTSGQVSCYDEWRLQDGPQDGAELFLPANFGPILANECVAELLKSHKFRVDVMPVKVV